MNYVGTVLNKISRHKIVIDCQSYKYLFVTLTLFLQRVSLSIYNIILNKIPLLKGKREWTTLSNLA